MITDIQITKYSYYEKWNNHTFKKYKNTFIYVNSILYSWSNNSESIWYCWNKKTVYKYLISLKEKDSIQLFYSAEKYSIQHIYKLINMLDSEKTIIGNDDCGRYDDND